MAHRVALAVFLTLIATHAYSDGGPSPDIATRTRGSARVVVARVVDVQSRFQKNQFGDQLIVSDVALDVTETLKGKPAATAVVEMEGGTVGDLTLRVSDISSVKPGDRAVFFLDSGDRGPDKLHDRGRGVLKLTSDDRIEGTTTPLTDVRREIQAAAKGAR